MENKELMMVLDGNTCFNFDLAANKQGKEIDLFGLTEICANLMSVHLGCNCTVPNEYKNIYMGYENNVSEKRRQFNCRFMGAGYHWCGAELHNGKEKEIDARFDDDVLSAAYRGKIGGVILLTNDRDHRPLAQTLKRLKIPTFLIYDEVFDGNGKKTTGYSKDLYDICDFKLRLFSLLENPKIFKPLNVSSSSVQTIYPVISAPRKEETVSAPKNVVVVKRKTSTEQHSINTPVPVNQRSGSFTLQQKIFNAVKQVIKDKETRWNTSLRFALTAEVGDWLKENQVYLPYGQSLTDFFRANPSVFHIGKHPRTGAATVSV